MSFALSERPQLDFQEQGLAGLLTQTIFYPAAILFGELGLNTPAKRASVGALIGYLLQDAIRPDISWQGPSGREHRKPRPWYGLGYGSLVGGDDSIYNSGGKPTVFPWWAWPLTFGGVFGFIF